MKIVIDIPLEWLFDMKNKKFCQTDSLYQKILNGTLLPKGHGRLIDADELFWDIQTDEQMRLGEHLAWVKERIDSTPTIIEAEAESEVSE